ncbi:unnamed protein product [Bursaphelenchus okinawaensis]|uniref:EamA domain-containing protein n=1 Tax=Bursaphelenchus okinawaensis TaxID=465554 RepID=A0A811LFH9_9BILA|nr:unnamed protein product [Bursaphelenchus okinawaensis]CAG9122010.1 unnamed protein product [Bursaphelenchus okinawaensis]
MTDSLLKTTILSIFAALSIAFCATFAGQFAQEALTIDETTFFASYFLTYLNTMFMLPLYPLFLLGRVFIFKEKAADVNRNAFKIWKNEKGKRYPMYYIAPVAVCVLYGWVAPNYIFAVALKFISVSAAVSIKSLNAALVFLLSVVWLKSAFSWFKGSGVLFSIAGVVIVSLNDEFTGSLTGVLFMLLCATIIAMYNVCVKKIFGDLNLGQVLFFLSSLGLTDVIVNTIPTFLMVYFDVERVVWSKIPWQPVICNLIMASLYNISVNFGIALLNPLVVSIGILVAIPVSAAVDILFHGLQAGVQVMIGGLLICIGFLLSTLPIDEWRKPKPHPINQDF